MIIENLHGEELFSYLRVNKSSLIENKKSNLKLCDSVKATVEVSPREPKTATTKDEGEESTDSPTYKDSIDVTIVCNTANLIDSHMDMLTDDAYTESIKRRGNTIPHLLDHVHSAVGHIGDVNKVYTKSIALSDLGLDSECSTTALIMESSIRKDYNTKAFEFYSKGKINQHSIGLSYDEINLAINSSHEDDKKAKEIWDKFYPKVINKDIADKRGYFWVVPKVDIRENSAVLFGANPLTPTLSAKGEALPLKDLDIQSKDVTTTPQQLEGTTMAMTLEEAMTKLFEKDAELQAIKASTSLEVAKAVKSEVSRIKGILEAAKTFEVENDSAIKFIDLGASIDTVVASFEIVKASKQSATHVDTHEGSRTPLGKSDVPKDSSFLAGLDEAIKSVGSTEQLFVGVK